MDGDSPIIPLTAASGEGTLFLLLGRCPILVAMDGRAQIVDGHAIAARIRDQACKRLEHLKRSGRTVRVAAVFACEELTASIYVHKQCQRFAEAGIQCSTHELTGKVTEDEILDLVRRLNDDSTVTGIVLALPLPAGLDVRRLQEAILPVKDVEGVHPHNLGLVTVGRRCVGPSTAQAVVEVLESTGVSFQGREAVVVGHSEIVGKPVALALMERLATVTVCHVATRDLAFHTRRAEILVVAVGRAGLITADMVSNGAVVVDVGINRVTGPDGTVRTVGDVAFEDVAKRASWITPVPGGVGPVTVAVLLRNAVAGADPRSR